MPLDTLSYFAVDSAHAADVRSGEASQPDFASASYNRQLVDTPAKAPARTKPGVAILLCTLDGARFLPDQLASIAGQSHSNWRLIVSDDGSRDHTCDIIERFAATFDRSRVELRHGPRQGASANFLSLASDATIDSDYFAYCDQDDIWIPGKLDRAIAWLERVPRDVPALYCSRTRLIRANGQPYGHSPLFALEPSFRNAVVQSVGGGNTMVFNRAARELLVYSAGVDVPAHDWWTYIMVTGAGGQAFYDPVPSLDYRQHGKNQVGAGRGFIASVSRLLKAANGRFRNWNSMNVRALQQCDELLTPDSRFVLRRFMKVHAGSTAAQRITALWKTGFYRQTKLDQLSLLAAALLGRV